MSRETCNYVKYWHTRRTASEHHSHHAQAQGDCGGGNHSGGVGSREGGAQARNPSRDARGARPPRHAPACRLRDGGSQPRQPVLRDAALRSQNRRTMSLSYEDVAKVLALRGLEGVTPELVEEYEGSKE